MKSVKIIFSMALFIGSGFTTAFAGPAGQTYVGGQYALVTYEESGFGDLEPTALVGRFGHYLNDNFAIEGRLGFGLGDDSTNAFGVDVTLEIDTLFGVYGVGQFNFTEKAAVYGVVGFTRGEVTASANAFGVPVSVSDSETDLSFGVGFNFAIAKNVDLNLEYMSYLSKSNFDVSAIGLGATYRF